MADTLPKNAKHGYAVVRIDEFLLPTASLESCISVKAIFDDAGAAEREVERLNILSGEGVRYFWQATRLKKTLDPENGSASPVTNGDLQRPAP